MPKNFGALDLLCLRFEFITCLLMFFIVVGSRVNEVHAFIVMHTEIASCYLKHQTMFINIFFVVGSRVNEVHAFIVMHTEMASCYLKHQTMQEQASFIHKVFPASCFICALKFSELFFLMLAKLNKRVFTK